MGLTSLEIEVENPDDSGRSQPVVGLIDTGAIFSAVPSAVLHNLAKPSRCSRSPTAQPSFARKASRYSDTATDSAARPSYSARPATAPSSA